MIPGLTTQPGMNLLVEETGKARVRSGDTAPLLNHHLRGVDPGDFALCRGASVGQKQRPDQKRGLTPQDRSGIRSSCVHRIP